MISCGAQRPTLRAGSGPELSRHWATRGLPRPGRRIQPARLLAGQSGGHQRRASGVVRVLTEAAREFEPDVKQPDVLGWAPFDMGRYCIVQELGRGAFGTVVEAEDEEAGDSAVAIKIMSKLRQGQTPTQTANKLRWEAGLLQRVQRETPNVVRALGLYEDPINVYIVMEKLSGGTLQEHLKKKGGRLAEDEVRWIAKDVLSFIAACHANDIVYADAKPANFMLTTAKDGRPRVKAIDMGCSQPVPAGSYIPMCSGTMMFTAPEVLRERRCGHESDVWSAGVMLYIMLSGTNPFYDPIAQGRLGLEDLKEIIQDDEPDFRESDWYDINPVAKDLVQLMLCRDPEMRISARGALLHEWFTDNEAEASSIECQDPQRKRRAGIVLSSMDDHALGGPPSHLL